MKEDTKLKSVLHFVLIDLHDKELHGYKFLLHLPGVTNVCVGWSTDSHAGYEVHETLPKLPKPVPQSA